MMDDFPEGGIDYEFIRKTSKTGVFGFMRIVSAYILCRNPAWNSLTDLLGFLFGNRIKLRTRPIGGKFPGRFIARSRQTLVVSVLCLMSSCD